VNQLALRPSPAVLPSSRPPASAPDCVSWSSLPPQPATFNLFGPLKQKLPLATAVLAQLCPDLAGTVTAILFEHSPSRGDPAFTCDGTAFDALLRLTLASGAPPFVAIEVKYAEGGGGPAGRHITDAAPTVPRFTRLFADPATTALTQHTA
jgi:hypothetical protein